MSWNSFFLGDYPTAMENALNALRQADELGLSIEKAWALDAVASVYGITQDFSNALKAHKESVALFKEHHDVDGMIRATNNLAMTLYEMQDYPPALELILECLQLAERWEREHDILNVSCSIAQISIDMGLFEQARQYLDKAFANAKVLEKTNIYHVFVLMEWARLFLKQNDLQNAKSNLIMALNIAEDNSQKLEQAKCHQSLSKIYERQNDYKRALNHQYLRQK